MDDHLVHTISNHHSTKMDVLPKTFVQLIQKIPSTATTFAFSSVFFLLLWLSCLLIGDGFWGVFNNSFFANQMVMYQISCKKNIICLSGQGDSYRKLCSCFQDNLSHVSKNRLGYRAEINHFFLLRFLQSGKKQSMLRFV